MRSGVRHDAARNVSVGSSVHIVMFRPGTGKCIFDMRKNPIEKVSLINSYDALMFIYLCTNNNEESSTKCSDSLRFLATRMVHISNPYKNLY